MFAICRVVSCLHALYSTLTWRASQMKKSGKRGRAARHRAVEYYSATSGPTLICQVAYKAIRCPYLGFGFVFHFFVFGAELLPECLMERYILSCATSIVRLARERSVSNQVSVLAILCVNSLGH